MSDQHDNFSDFSAGAADQYQEHQQHQGSRSQSAFTPALTHDDIDAIAREIDDLPRVEKFDVKAQLARLGPSLDAMKNKGYDLAAIRSWLAERDVHASISSISRAITGGVVAKPKRKNPKAAK